VAFSSLTKGSLPYDQMRKEKKDLVVRPERYVVIEDLNFSSLRVGRPDFCPVSVPWCGSAGQRYGISDFKWFKNISVFYDAVRPCDSDINLLDKVEPFAAPHSSDYLRVRGKTIALDLDFDVPGFRKGLGWSWRRRYGS